MKGNRKTLVPLMHFSNCGYSTTKETYLGCLQDFTLHGTWYYQKLFWLAITVAHHPVQHTVLLCNVIQVAHQL